MLFTLPRHLHYPITITKFMVHEGDEVELGTQLFTYTYTTTVSQINRLKERKDVQISYPATYESPVEGKFLGWKIEEKTYVESPIPVAEIEELCAHDVVFGGLCAICGKDMMRVESYIKPIAPQPAVRIINEESEIIVSQSELKRDEENAKRRLLNDRKLSLVVDLDQTIIHATVDPTVAEWQNDPTNPNYEAVKDVKAFQLAEDAPRSKNATTTRLNDEKADQEAAANNGCWYYIKLRPGLLDFLEKISQLYELHIYTMGTRAYAQEVAKLVDPTKKIFGDRILSRDESGSLTAKNLQRLFPVDTKMVVIIDDRGDVWNWTENLIKVAPYDFFVGIGDINSSFLPKKPALEQGEQQNDDATKEEEALLAASEEEESGPKKDQHEEVSTVDQLVTMGGGDDKNLLQEQTEKRDETIQQQVEDRPLLRQQKALDEDAGTPTPEDDSAAQEGDSTATNKTDSSETPSTTDSVKERHHLLNDDDRELDHIFDRLTQVHDEFFEVFERRKTNAGIAKDVIDLSLLPDVKNIMSSIKWKILEGVKIVYTGVLPLGVNIQDADLSLWAKSFGATIQPRINPRTTTHLVAGKPRTAKAKEAAKWPKKIKIVRLNWLLDSLTQWKRLDETDYLMAISPEDRRNARKARKEGKEVEDIEAERANGLDDGAAFGDTDDEDDDDDDGDGTDLFGSDFDGTSIMSEDEDEEADKVLENQIRQSAGLTETSTIGIAEDEQDLIHDELREFLGSDADDSSEESDAELAEMISKKRKREAEDEENLRNELDDLPGVRSAVHPELIHRAKRPTGLREVQNAADEPRPKSPGLTPPPGTTIPTVSARVEGPPTLDPLRGGDLEAVDYNAYSPKESPEEAAKDPVYTAADAYDDANYDRGGKYQLGGVVQPAEELAADGDDDALEREMLAAFEEDGWGAPEEEAHAEGVEQGNEGGPDVALKEGDVGDLTEEQKEAQKEGQFGTWGGEGNGPLGVGDPRYEEGDEAYSK
ncbi:hypothetical protein KEM56_000866 [Ascosphaera pollenicola]|nr:hypothetical protein KEM56_000866 [Ascosphaera pollenicola]